MNTELTLAGRTLHLTRYPTAAQHPSLQAWDAADELLINHVVETYGEQFNGRCHIYNDDFGALGCWFAAWQTDWVNDSFVARQALQANLDANQLMAAEVNCHDPLWQPASPVDRVLIKIPKTTALLEHQLAQLQPWVGPETQIIAAGKVKAIHTSTLKLFERYLGPTTTSLAKKKARLIFCTPTASGIVPMPPPTEWYTDNPRFRISNHANVFARQQLDIGARFLLDNLPDCSGQRIIDLGCGNGVLGLHVLAQWPDSRVTFVDESFMAIASARDNVTGNLQDGLQRSEFLVSNCLEQFSGGQVDRILCNPPFHQQNTITDHIADQMFADARQHLRPGGELRIIGNRHLDYPAKLKRLFGGYTVVAANRKFSILSAIKR